MKTSTGSVIDLHKPISNLWLDLTRCRAWSCTCTSISIHTRSNGFMLFGTNARLQKGSFEILLLIHRFVESKCEEAIKSRFNIIGIIPSRRGSLPVRVHYSTTSSLTKKATQSNVNIQKEVGSIPFSPSCNYHYNYNYNSSASLSVTYSSTLGRAACKL